MLPMDIIQAADGKQWIYFGFPLFGKGPPCMGSASPLIGLWSAQDKIQSIQMEINARIGRSIMGIRTWDVQRGGGSLRVNYR